MTLVTAFIWVILFACLSKGLSYSLFIFQTTGHFQTGEFSLHCEASQLLFRLLNLAQQPAGLPGPQEDSPVLLRLPVFLQPGVENNSEDDQSSKENNEEDNEGPDYDHKTNHEGPSDNQSPRDNKSSSDNQKTNNHHSGSLR